MPHDRSIRVANPGANRPLVWGLLILALALGAAGYAFDWWHSVPWYDEAVHFLNTFAITLWIALWAYGAVLAGADRHPVGLVLVIVLLGVGLGGLWEIWEWARDHLLAPGNVILGKMDTMWDLVIDAGGALLAGLLTLRLARRAART